MVDFRTLLNKPADDIKRPPPLPAGTYYGIIAKHEFGESQNKKTPYVRFLVNVNRPGEDVDEEELKASEIDLSSKQMRMDFYLTDDALYRLKEFLESLGIDMTGRALGECIPDALNQSVILEVTQDINQKDPTAPPYNNVKTMRGDE